MALTPLQVSAAAYIGGFTGDDNVKAVQLAYTVSALDPKKAVNDHYGLWQIKKGAHPDLFKKYKWDNPADNARMANFLWQKRASLLHPSGQWSTKDWGVVGNATYNQYKMTATAAYNELKKQIGKGKSAESILGTSRTDGSKTPEGGVGGTVVDKAGDAVDAVQGIGSALGNLDALASALQNKNTWIRAAEAMLGITLIVVGLIKLAGPSAVNAIPAGRIAKKVLK
jgi:hypothetical protein